MGNSAGLYGVLAALFRPGLVVPNVIVPDITHLDWQALRKAGVSHLIFDKDNCITLPLQDSIVPELEQAWKKCTEAGFETILIVSNSAGSSDDALGIGAETLSRKLGQLVLAHPAKKPAMACAKQILEVVSQREGEALSSISPSSSGHIAVIGDRVTTDIILASRMQRLLVKRKTSRQAIGILSTTVFSRERLGTRMMRGMEMRILERLQRVGIQPGASWRRSGRDTSTLPTDWQSIATARPLASTSPLIAEVAERQDLPAEAISLRERMRDLPSKASGAAYLAGARSLSWLGAGWQLINDGIHLGTKGYIGSPDVSLRRTRLEAGRTSLLGQGSAGFISPPSHAAEKPFQTTGQQQRHYSSNARPTPPPSGSRRRMQGWPAAVAAIVLIPSCWYGGVLLREWQEGKQPFSDAATTLSTTQENKAQAMSQQSQFHAAPPSLASSSRETQSIRTELWHLQREKEDIDERLERLEQRRN